MAGFRVDEKSAINSQPTGFSFEPALPYRISSLGFYMVDVKTRR